MPSLLSVRGSGGPARVGWRAGPLEGNFAPPMDTDVVVVVVDVVDVGVIVVLVVVAAGIVVADIAGIAVVDIAGILGISAAFAMLHQHYQHRYHVPMPKSLDLETSSKK